jgi:hypothetical protein
MISVVCKLVKRTSKCVKMAEKVFWKSILKSVFSKLNYFLKVFSK